MLLILKEACLEVVSYSSPLITNKQTNKQICHCSSPHSNVAPKNMPELVFSDIAGCSMEHSVTSKTTQAPG